MPYSQCQRLIMAHCLSVICVLAGAAHALDLTEVRLGKHRDFERVVFDVSGFQRPVLRALDARVYELSLPRTKWRAGPRLPAQAAPALIEQISLSSPVAATDLKLKLKLRRDAAVVLTTLQNPPRVLLDVRRTPTSAATSAPQSQPAVARVVIDPGHGGRAPGAVGPKGTLEKDVVLAICKRLSAELNTLPGIEAVLTRGTDKSLSLGQRINIARDKQVDLFVSVHADAINDATVRGGSVYVLSNTGANNAARRWAGTLQAVPTAKRNLAGIDLAHRDASVANVLYDLVQTDTLERSNLLAQDVLTRLQRSQRVRFKEVRLANLGVLKAPDIPSVLVETAFISNPDDERLLNSSSGQRELARAIAEGIRGFLQRPTEIARIQAPARIGTPLPNAVADVPYQEYAVTKGDTLYGLGRRFGVPSQRIREFNALVDNLIVPGMKLRIPIPARVVAAGN